MLGTILIVILILMLLGSFPTWPHSRNWGYGPARSDHQRREGDFVMSRFVWMLMLAGLFAALGCERKPADRTPGKITSEDVRRDRTPEKVTPEDLRRDQMPEKVTSEEVRRDRMPERVTSEDVRRDAGHAVRTAAEYSRQTKEEFQKNLDARLKELDAKIATFREKGRNLKDEAKANWDRKMAELELKRDAARVRRPCARQCKSSDQ